MERVREMYITKKELVWRTYPDKVNTNFIGGVLGCPSDYNLSEICCCEINVDYLINGKSKCEICWLQFIDENTIVEFIPDESEE